MLFLMLHRTRFVALATAPSASSFNVSFALPYGSFLMKKLYQRKIWLGIGCGWKLWDSKYIAIGRKPKIVLLLPSFGATRQPASALQSAESTVQLTPAF